MSEEFLILEGKNYDKLVEEGTKKFNVKKEELHIEILEQKKSLFSSYFKLKISLDSERKLKFVEKSLSDLGVTEEPKAVQKQVEFIYKEDGVYLQTDGSAPLDYILFKISQKKIQNAYTDNIKAAIKPENSGRPFKIAEPQQEILVDSACEIKIAKDVMQAFVHVLPPIGGKHIQEDTIYNALMEKKVTFGILDDEIKRIVSERFYEKDILVAQGLPAQNGADAALEYHFDTSNEKKIKMNEDGKMDYRELSIIHNVQKGQELVTLIPNKSGMPGKNVLGLEIPAKDGVKLALPKGKNVETSADGLKLIAAISGEVKLIEGKVSVFSVYEVKSNVDNSTGNIRFVGKVIINGNVITGFTVEADGDVEVYGVVEGAKIVATGNIILHRGIQGANRGELYCDGDLIAKFIENSKIEVKGNLHSDAIMHSQIVCGGKLEAAGKKGLLVGGSFKVGEEVKAKVIGSPMATVTEIEVGVNPEQRKRYDTLKAELKQNTDNLEKATQAVDLLTKLNAKIELPDDKKILLSKSMQAKIQLTQKCEDLVNEISDLEAYFEDITRGKIKVSGVIYPGSRINIGNSMMYIKDPIQYSTFYRSEAEVKIAPFEE